MPKNTVVVARARFSPWLVLGALLSVAACGGDESEGAVEATGGDGAQAPSGGASGVTGGAQGAAVGGSLGGGGSSSTSAGAPSSGGATTTGGASSTSTGGGVTTGGGPGHAGGGATSTGGALSSGGAPQDGGAPASGAGPDTGGAPATGGTEAMGGRPDSVTPAPGATLVTVDPVTRYQQFEGWGTSLCWWANRIGGWATENMNQFLELVVDPEVGLGYNIFRYNIGGGDDPSHDHMREYGDMPGFLSEQGVWDWNADARQAAVLSRLVSTGQGVILEAFSNSPPYFMTQSGCASGSANGSDNLRDDSYEAFADYLTEVVRHYRDELGITFRTLEPLNEPNANWWTANGGQEGCHFGPSSQARIIQAVGEQLEAKGLVDTRVSASDENSMNDAYSIIGGYDATTLGFIDQINVHSYAGSQRNEIRELAASSGKRLWQSESGPLGIDGLNSNTQAALFMAGRIVQDLRELRPAAWVDWQTVDTSNPWTSFTIDDRNQTGAPVKRFYMHATFSRFIRPGATFIDIDHSDMVAALAADGSAITVVAVNDDVAASEDYTFDLTGLPSVGTQVEVHRTSETEDLEQLPSIAIDNWSFTATVAPYSVTAYLIPIAR